MTRPYGKRWNTSEAFAATAKQLPIIGAVSKVLTFRNYDTADGEKEIHVEIPEIQEESGNESIHAQMKERMAQNPDLAYWDGSNGIDGFSTVDETTKFYIGRSGNPVIVFDKYEIAPGAFGAQKFEVARE